MLIIYDMKLLESRPFAIISKKIIEHANKKNINYLHVKWGDYKYNNYAIEQIQKILNKDTVFVWINCCDARFENVYEKFRNLRHYGIMHCDVETLSNNKISNKKILKNFDKVFVPSYSLKNCLDVDKVHVTGLPLPENTTNNKNTTKKNICVFPHRFASDRNPKKFINLAKFWNENIDKKLEFYFFTSCKKTFRAINNKYKYVNVVYNRTKKEYYEKLSEVKFVWSDSLTEAFPTSIIEGYFSGAVPILNNIACYNEFFTGCIYNNFDEQIELIKTLQYDDIKFNFKDNFIKNIFNFFEGE